MERDGWRNFLKRWSGEWIAAHDAARDRPLDEDVVRDSWLGFRPAAAADVAAAETRLGRPLPPSLRNFLQVTDGWRNTDGFIYRLAGTRELAWLRDTDDSHWIEAYSGHAPEGQPDDGDLLRRSLRISTAGDSAILFLDPEDVDEHGEWAAYRLASWSGTGPRRHGSFSALMHQLYASFYALRRPPGETRDYWDAEVERARLAALGGEVDEPLAVFDKASTFGRVRAQLLSFQLRALLGDWHTVPLSHVVVPVDRRTDLLADPLFAAELLPLLFAEDRLGHRRELTTLRLLRQMDPEPFRRLIDEYQTRLGQPGFQLSFGNPEFDAAVHRLLARIAADPAFHDRHLGDVQPRWQGPAARSHRAAQELVRRGRRRLIDAAWPELREAMKLWRPASENHVAPVVLFAHPVLAEMISPERGRELLSVWRGHA